VKNILFKICSCIMALILVCFAGCGKEENKGSKVPKYDVTKRVALDENEVEYVKPNVDTYYNYIEVYDDKNRLCTIGDPFILKYNGLFYLYSSCTGNHIRVGIPCWTSTNMVDWEFRSWVWGDGETDYGTEGLTYNAYAPEIVYYKGWFYLCEAPNGAGHYIFKSKTPDGKFELCSDNLGLGIDGSFYVSDSGELYLFSASGGYSGGTTIYTKLKVEDGRVVKSGYPVVVPGVYMGMWTEGPGTIEKDGYRYLYYTGNHVNSAGYRMAYAYTTEKDYFSGVKTKGNNILLLNTGDDELYNKKGYNSNNTYVNVATYRGLGHGCIAYGPNLDSMYLGYHNEGQGRLNHAGVGYDDGYNEKFDRRYNMTQVFSDKANLSTNGICITDTPKPFGADFTTSTLTTFNGYNLTSQSTKNVFTAEVNFKLSSSYAKVIVGYQDNSNYTEIVINGSNLLVNRYIGGNFSNLLTTTVLECENQEDNFHAIKVVNGFSNSSIYYDNVLVGKVNSAISGAGRVGVASSIQNGVIAFSNDAYGTADNEAIKNLTSTFPAINYLKEENRGFSIENAEVKQNGARQGEKESTKQLGDSTAVVLKANDWVKYAINASKTGTYALNVAVSQKSLGCIFEVIVNEKDIYKMEVKNAKISSGYVMVNAGTFKIKEEGIQSLKIRVFYGELDMVSISTQRNADVTSFSESLSSNFTNGFKVMGTVSYSNGLITSFDEVKTLYYYGGKGVSNFETSVDVTLLDGYAGIVFRAKNFSYSKNLATVANALQGYYLRISEDEISLDKYNYSAPNENWIDSCFCEIGQKKNTIKIKVVQNQISVYLNGKIVLSYVDEDPFIDGYCGLYTQNSNVKYSNLTYKVL